MNKAKFLIKHLIDKGVISKEVTSVKKRILVEGAEELGFKYSDYSEILRKENNIAYGVYSIVDYVEQSDEPRMSSVPLVNKNFVKFGSYKDLETVILTREFYPVYLYGDSGIGKTEMVENICGIAEIPVIRTQITKESNMDSLIGGLRLEDGNTVMYKGPVVRAAEEGALLILDEIDRGSNALLCLQNVLEGKPFRIPNTDDVITPRQGFQIVATANTSGDGVSHRFSGAMSIDSATLERFSINIKHTFPTEKQELSILKKAAGDIKDFEVTDEDMLEFSLLSKWSNIIRKTYLSGGIDEFISPRRLVMILRNYHIFSKDIKKAIKYAIDRYDEETKEAFLEIYNKLKPSGE